MFNFFNEVKKGLEKYGTGRFNMVNLSGHILYVEGHLGITQLSKQTITFKIKGGRIVVQGEELVLQELSDTTLKVSGKIISIEEF